MSLKSDGDGVGTGDWDSSESGEGGEDAGVETGAVGAWVSGGGEGGDEIGEPVTGAGAKEGEPAFGGEDKGESAKPSWLGGGLGEISGAANWKKKTKSRRSTAK